MSDGCTCHKCGRIYKVDLVIPDKLWNKISETSEMLCGSCIMDAIERLGEYGYLIVFSGFCGLDLDLRERVVKMLAIVAGNEQGNTDRKEENDE